MNKEIKNLSKIFKLDSSRRKGLSPRGKRQNGRPNHVLPRNNFLGEKGSNFPWRKGLSYFNDQLFECLTINCKG
jgi:hypothetical protein